MSFFKKNQTCSIYKKTITDKDGSQILTDTLIATYTNIPCTYWWAWKVRNFNDTRTAREVDLDRFDVDIDALYRDKDNPILKWYKIKITDSAIWVEWYYMIDNLETFHTVAWIFNNVYIRCTRMSSP